MLLILRWHREVNSTCSYQQIYFILCKNENVKIMILQILYLLCIYVQWPYKTHGQAFNIWISLIKIGITALVFNNTSGIFFLIRTVQFSKKKKKGKMGGGGVCYKGIRNSTAWLCGVHLIRYKFDHFLEPLCSSFIS